MGWIRRMRALGQRGQLDREIESELREHMQMCIDDNIARGMRPEQAAREARLRFGNPTTAKELVDAEDAAVGVESLVHDVRYALRGFRRNPVFAGVVILTLALGIGANTAVFQLLDAIRMRSLPIRNPGDLTELRIAGGNGGFGINDNPYANFTVPMWQELRRHHDPLSGVFAWRATDMLAGKLSDAKRIHALEVSGEFFNVLGIAPWQGRLIEPQDEETCKPSRAVVSYPYWRSQMGGQPITPNTSMMLDGESVQILGVTPPSFFGLSVGDRFDVAILRCIPPKPPRELFILSVMGRLRPGWTLARATAWFAAFSPALFEATAPDGYSAEHLKIFKSFRLAAYPAGRGVSVLRSTYDSSLELLLAITGLVLLIACANLANLMLARAGTRQREMAIRMALGASRERLLRQMFLESGLLAVCGASIGIALAQPLSRLLVASLATSQDAIQLSIATDWRVLLFAAAVASVTCVVFGTVPAMRSARVDPITSIKAGQRGLVGNRERSLVQRLMVITQIAVSMVLLVGALLFVGSYRNLMSIDPGMREAGITAGYLNFASFGIKPEQIAAFKRKLVEDIRSVPGIENAAATTNVPIAGGSWSHEVRVGGNAGGSKFTYVSPSYFATMGIPLLSGRNFTRADTTGAPFVLIVNRAFVRRFLAGASPIGQLVHVLPEPNYPERTYQIVGTIPDTKYEDIRAETPPMAFVPIDQFPVTAQGPWAAVMIASRDSAAASRAVRRTLSAEYPGMTMELFSFQQSIRDALVGDRMMATLSGFFGFLAAVLVIVGLYGVLAYLVAQRRNEIGIRMALGASRGQVIGLVLRDTAAMLLAGVAIGTVLALVAGRGAGSMLFGVKAWDPSTLAASALLLGLVALLTSWIPARAAAHLDPITSLRSE